MPKKQEVTGIRSEILTLNEWGNGKPEVQHHRPGDELAGARRIFQAALLNGGAGYC